MSATSVAAFLRRDLLLLRRNTASLISMFVVPPLFLLCLYAVFGYSAGQSGFGYLRFVLGGCLFQAAMFTAAASAMAVGQDVESGLVDRVRVLPGATGGYVAGRLATDVLRMSASIAALLVVAWSCGLDMALGDVAWTVLWSLLAAAVLSLVTDGVILMVPAPVSTASSIQALEMLLLMFSTAFIPATALDGSLRDIVRHMPFSPVIEVIRAASPGAFPDHAGEEAALWLGVAAVVGIVLFIRRFTLRSES
ncbi:ABC transporter permease [Corynebacterium aurimucosum]|uniref:ABC transporter permease n=1 Tax=Corynebacterium aurimucosum TaxID=169292 RepID=UPI0039905032